MINFFCSDSGTRKNVFCRVDAICPLKLYLSPRSEENTDLGI